MKHYNDYSVIAFLSTGEAKKWRTVNKLQGFTKFLDEKHPDWIYMNVYESSTKTYLKRFHKGDSVPDFL